MFTIGQKIEDTKGIKRLYVTTRNSQEIGMYRQGSTLNVAYGVIPLYYITQDQVVTGVFTSRSEAETKLGDILAASSIFN